MLRDLNFRLGLISTIFTLSILILLPRIPIKIDNQFIKVDSYIGGYYIKFIGDDVALDMRDFKKSLDFGGGKRYVYQINTDVIVDEKLTNTVREVFWRRLDIAGYKGYKVRFSSEDPSKIVIDIPTYQDDENILFLTQGSGKLVFKQLKDPEAWDPEEFNKFYTSPELWEETNVTERDVENIVVTSKGPGVLQIKFIFSSEGREKFVQVAKNNINKPLSLNLDNSDYPTAVPTVTQELFQSEIIEPVITGPFDKKEMEALFAKVRAPRLQIPTNYIGASELKPIHGSSFMRNLFYAISVSLVSVILYLVFKYGKVGLLVSAVLIFGVLLSLSLHKVFSIVINIHSLFGIIASLGLLTYGLLLFSQNVNLDKEMLDISVLEAFNKSSKHIKGVGFLCWLLFLIAYFLGTTGVRWFSASISIGGAVLLVVYFVALKTFIQAFSFGKGNKKQ